MSQRGWVSYVAIGGVAALVGVVIAVLGWQHLAYQQRQHAQERQEAASHKNENAAEQRQTTCIDVAKRTTFPCVTNSPPAEGGEKYTEYDLHAQQDMAEWAFAMVLVSLLGVMVTTAATIYVALTFHQTQALVREAKNTTKAAQDALEISERPWLSVEPEYSSTDRLATDQWKLNYRLLMANAGRSPAVKVEVRHEPCYASTRALDQLDKLIAQFHAGGDTPDTADSAANVFPDEHRPDDRWLVIERDGFDEIVRSSGANPTEIAIVGMVVYSSIFGDKTYYSTFVLDLKAKDMSGRHVPFIIAADGAQLWRDLEGKSRVCRGRIT